MSAITLNNVSLTFSGRKVLNNISLTVDDGEFVAIIGGSGGGKSTLLRLIAGLLKPTEGSVEASSQPAFVFQDYRLLPWRNALYNVQLPLQIQNQGLAPLEALKQVGMQDFKHYYPHELSGGMRARVAVARALAQQSSIMLFDEPFAALDALVRERFNEEIKRLHQKRGRTIVFVTHSIREAVYLADRVVVLKDGVIRAVIDTKNTGRVSAYTDGLEAELRDMLGQGNSNLPVKETVPNRPSLTLIYPFLSVVLAVVLWHMVSLNFSDLLLPSPFRVWQEWLSARDELSQQLLATLTTTLQGLGLGMVLGVALGYPLGKIPVLERVLSPFLVASQSTPTIVLAPWLMLWLGFGAGPGIVVSGLTAFYPIMIAVMVGVREVENTYHEVFDTLKASFWQRLKYLEAPGGLTVLLGGLKLSSSLALIGAVVWEFVSNHAGLGYAVNQARAYYNTPRMFAAIVLLSLLGGALYMLVLGLERMFLKSRRK